MVATRRRKSIPDAEIKPDSSPKKQTPSSPAQKPKHAGSNHKLIAAVAIVIASISASYEWPFYMRLESDWRRPAASFSLSFLFSIVVAVIVGLSPSARAFKAKRRGDTSATPIDNKTAFVGVGIILLGFFLAGGLFGCHGVVTVLSLLVAVYYLSG